MMMANDPYSKRLKSIKPKCNTLIQRKVHTNSIISLLKKICVKEGVEFEEHVVRNLAKRSNGDLRSAINDLEVIARGKEKIISEDLEFLSKKDDIVNIFDAVRTVLKSKNPRRIKDAMKVDAEPSFILELVAENIPREYEKVDELQRAYDMISLADIYLGRAFNTRIYTYWKYSYELMSLGVALSKEETYRKFSRFTNSSIFSMLSKSRAKRDLKNRVAEKMGEKLHASKKVVKEQFPYMEIMFQNDQTAYELATYYGLTDDEVKLFRSRKIKIKKAKAKALKSDNGSKTGLNGYKSGIKTRKTEPKQEKVKKSLKEKREDLRSEKKLKENKKEALTLQKAVYKKAYDINFVHTYVIVLLWNNEIEEAIKVYKDNFNNENVQKDVNELVNSILLMFLAKKQYNFVYQLFKENKFDLKDKYKPIYFALLSLMGGEYKDEFLKMGSELEETVEEIITRIKQLEIDYA